jgi:methyl-accepting chemotaxis protein
MVSNPSNDPTLGNARSSDAAADQALSHALADFLRTACRTTLERIQNVNGMTAREVLDAGAALERVMGEARAHVDKARSALSKAAGGDGRDGLRELARRQAEAIRGYLSDSQRLIAEQETMAKQSQAGSAKIAQLATIIEGIASQAKLLALNARIEAARLGTRGEALSVIASEMVRFSKEVGAANGAISEIAESICRDLPRVAAHASKLRESTERFSGRINGELDEIRDAGEALEQVLNSAMVDGDEAAERIVSHAYAALSHLQFQDACAQHLLSIDAVFQEILSRVPAAVEQSRTDLLAGDALQSVNRNLNLNAGDVSIFEKSGGAEASDTMDQSGGLVLF